MPDPKDAFDTADRALWGTRFKGHSCQLARHENDLGDQHQAIEQLRATDLKRQAEHAAVLEAFAAMREELAILQQAVTDMQQKNIKLTEHLKRRFAELRDEFKADRQPA
jgi:hypothetical protein